MLFRPLPVLTVFSLAALAVLISLGVWQLRRAEEKRAMIAAYEATEGAQALDWPLCVPVQERGGQTVARPTDFVGDRELRFFGTRAGSPPGWRILRPAVTPDCDCLQDCPWGGQLAVETDFVTLDGVRLGPPDALTLTRAPRANLFTPENDFARGEFYRWDSTAMSEAFGLPTAAVEREWALFARAPGLPPGLAAMPPSRHIGYALTWFGLAATLIGVYFAYHHQKGRLGRLTDV